MASVLAEFKPTVVITERDTQAPEYIDPYYSQFDDKMLSENANERVQVAFRLARKARVSRVYGIDESPSEGEPDYYPFLQLQEFAIGTGQEEQLNQVIAELQQRISKFGEETEDDHIALRLYKLNARNEEPDPFNYNLQKFDIGENQPGAELQEYWFMRNTKIWSKLMNVLEPGDRVVVVYGSGHKYWLEHLVRATPGYVAIDPKPYLLKAAGQ